jgi:hypothetical protein
MRIISLLCTFVLACCVGCGQSGFTVSGNVAFPDGSPVPRGQVTIHSNTFTAGGPITANGSYTINAPVPAGTYQVTVVASGDQPASTLDIVDVRPVPPLVDTKYGSTETSGLTIEVPGNRSFDLTVTAPQ